MMTQLFLSLCLSSQIVAGGNPPPVYFPVPLPQPNYVPSYSVPIDPIPFLPVQPQVPTVEEFFGRFKPCPGNYEVVVLHPHKKVPVRVCFTLPDCQLQRYEVNRRTVEFDYGKIEVRIIFRLFGKVDVKYDD